MRRIATALFLFLLSMNLLAQQREHVVQRGEDFGTIARKYGITEQELMAANPSSKACYAGRKLIIPQHGQPVERKVTPQPLDLQLLSTDEPILTQSAATTYQVGHALWKEGKLDEAFAYLNKAAESGEARAYYPLGECYSNKDSKLYDPGKAFECFSKATQQVKDKYDAGYWMSCRGMALLYRYGLSVNKDLAKARQYTYEYLIYTDPDGQNDANKLMSAIQAEERAIAAQELAEKRERAAKLLAEKEEKRRQQAEAVRAKNAKNAPKQGKASKASSTTQTAQNRRAQDKNNIPGYTQVAGGIPGVGETRYWHKSGSLGYCSVRSFQDGQGNVLYSIFPDPVDFNNPSSTYRQNGYRDGWIVFQRVRTSYSYNFPSSFLNPYAYTNMNNCLTIRLVDIPGEFLISTDGERVKSRSGAIYDTPVDKATVNSIITAQENFIARGIAAGIIQPQNFESEVSRQLKEEIEEIDRRQEARRREEMDIAEKRAELGRGHRIIRYNSTNVESTLPVECKICKKWDKPHTHPINDGRH